jgi:hypothetical protein
MTTLNIYLELCSSDLDVSLVFEVDSSTDSKTSKIRQSNDNIENNMLIRSPNNRGPSTPQKPVGRGFSRSISEGANTNKNRGTGKSSSKHKYPEFDQNLKQELVSAHSLSAISDSSLSINPSEVLNGADISRKFHEMRYKKKLSTKTKFLLKMNERVVYAICQCLNLLGNEFRRALQGKHWSQVIMCISSSLSSLKYMDLNSST